MVVVFLFRAVTMETATTTWTGTSFQPFGWIPTFRDIAAEVPLVI